MKSRLTCMLVMALAVGWLATSLNAEPIGFIQWSVNIPGTAGEFDIANETGPNSSVFPDTTFPVSTSVHLSSLSLTVNFDSGPPVVFGPSYFTLDPDGLSYSGGAIPIGGSNPQPVDATLTGTFSPLLVTLNDGSTETILPSFTAKIVTSGSPGDPLNDGDFAIIMATPAGGPPAVPEPSSWLLLGTAVLGLMMFQNKHLRRRFNMLCSAVKGHGALKIALFLCCLMVLPAASWAAVVNLNANTSPSSGVAGVSQVWVVANGVPAGTITPANVVVTLAPTCGAAPSATTSALAVQTVLGTTRKFKFAVPASLATGTYFVKISDSVDAGGFTSGNCSQISVTHTSSTLSGCAPASSLGIYSPPSGPAEVSALSPLGCWSCGTTGVKVVQLETGGGPVKPPVLLPTGAVVNSCTVNPATGEGICVGNDANVYTFDTAARTATGTFTSGSDAFTGFSGGSCHNCGIAVDALNNHAVIAMGHSGGLSGTALQVFDLATHTFTPPVQLFHQVSEDIVINPLTGYYLSANESRIFDIIPFTGSTGAPTGQFGNTISTIGGELDSTAVDCSTGIIAAPSEFTEQIVLADSTQATFVPGSPGTWTAPQTVFNFPSTFLSAGASAMVIAPGSSHLSVITGEFGGSSFIVAQLPSVSGAPNPAPTVVDWAYVSCVNGVNAGLDPHTVSAYTSPNDGKAYGVFASGGPPPTSIVRADLAGVLARPRNAGSHTVTGDSGGSCLAAGDGVIFSSGPI